MDEWFVLDADGVGGGVLSTLTSRKALLRHPWNCFLGLLGQGEEGRHGFEDGLFCFVG